jgi:hypothetical protein
MSAVLLYSYTSNASKAADALRDTTTPARRRISVLHCCTSILVKQVKQRMPSETRAPARRHTYECI